MPRGTNNPESTPKPLTGSHPADQTEEQLALEQELFAGLSRVKWPADLREERETGEATPSSPRRE